MDLLDSAPWPVEAGPPVAALDEPASAPAHAHRSLSRAEVALGRALDLAVAVVALVVLSPLLAAIAVLVRLTSPGPALFRQERLGRDMRPFQIYKFRTMRTDASEEPHRAYVQALIRTRTGDDEPRDGSLYKLSVDRRITPVGRRLRSWSLDELPQLINVVRGEMALVGPRPVIPYEAELYPEAYRRRFAVKPGLTGLWQVSGRNERTYHEMITFDLQYAEQHSPWLDVKILLRTIPVVLGRRGVA